MDILNQSTHSLHKTIELAKEIQGMLTEDESILGYEKLVDKAILVTEKASKAMEQLERTENSLENQKAILRNEIKSTYHANIPEAQDEPDVEKVEEILKNEDRKLRDLTDKLNTIVDEKKEVTFAKKHLKLQQAALPIQFDVESTRENVKGFIKRTDGKIEVFEFNLINDDQEGVADYLWGTGSKDYKVTTANTSHIQ